MSAERWYRLLLRFYPPPFRARFEAGMRDALRREYARATASGRFAVAAFWLWTSLDAARFGSAERLKRRTRGPSMKSLLVFDVRDALRSLRATPVVTFVAIVSLALGIGANTALFSILNSLLLKTLPVRDPARLVLIDGGSWTNPIWEQIRARRHDIFEDAFAWSGTRVNLSTHGATDFVDGAWASGTIFDVLGVKPRWGGHSQRRTTCTAVARTGPWRS
jgi:hypothetical protein